MPRKFHLCLVFGIIGTLINGQSEKNTPYMGNVSSLIVASGDGQNVTKNIQLDSNLTLNSTNNGDPSENGNHISVPPMIRVQGFLACLGDTGKTQIQPENLSQTGLDLTKIYSDVISPCLAKQGFSEIKTGSGSLKIDTILNTMAPFFMNPLTNFVQEMLLSTPLLFPRDDESSNLAKLYNSMLLTPTFSDLRNNSAKTNGGDTRIKEAILKPFFLRPLRVSFLSNDHKPQNLISQSDVGSTNNSTNITMEHAPTGSSLEQATTSSTIKK